MKPDLHTEDKGNVALPLKELLFPGGDEDLVNTEGVKVTSDVIEGKGLGILVGPSWCMTFMLNHIIPAFSDTIKEIVDQGKPLQMVYVPLPGDESLIKYRTDKGQGEEVDWSSIEESFSSFIRSLPLGWLSVPLSNPQAIEKLTEVSESTLIGMAFVGADGHLITIDGRELLMGWGADAYPFTEEHVKKLEEPFAKLKRSQQDAVDIIHEYNADAYPFTRDKCAARVVPLSFEDSEEFELDSMVPEEQQNGAVESQYQDTPYDLSRSVIQMCRLISQELEGNASDSSVIIISNDWLIKWQSDDDKVYAKLLDYGYMKTFETDTYSCFENILHTSDGGCSRCDDVQSKLDMSPKHIVATGTSQESERYKDCSEFIHDASSGAEMPDGINVDDHGTRKQSLEEADNSGEENVLTATEAHDSKVSSTCSGNCPHIPGSVVTRQDGATTSDNPKAAAAVKLHALKWKTEGGMFKVPLALSCCVNDEKLSIKFSCFKGEIYPASAGTVLRQTVLSVSAKVDDQTIVLRPVDPENDRGRVCSRGNAQYEFNHGKPGKTVREAKFEPDFLIGGVSLGAAGMHEQDDRVPVQVCGRGDCLDLVTLRVGHAGCNSFDFQKVLVLQRNIANTYLARENRDVTSMDSQADSRPLVLMGNLPSSSDYGHRQRSVEISCCAKLEIDFIPEEWEVREVVKREMMCKVEKRHTWVSLCHNPGTDHVTFKGMATTTRM